MLHILNELRVLKASAQAQESSSPPFWRRFSRSAWPNELPQGVGGDWDGWSSVPDLQQDWDAKHKESVMLALRAQYTRAGLKMPDSWQSLQCHNCRVVTVGHQLVLAGGPAFFHHKILTAIRVARGLSKTSGQPIVPLFWMASEDHDWKEISSVHGVNQAHSWTPRHSHIPRPVGQLSLDGLGEVLQEWMADGLSDQIATDMWTDFEASVAAGECLSGLMRRWLHRWYGSDGLLVLDPQDEDLKTLGASLWAKEFEGRGVHDALHGSAAMDGPALVRENNIFWMDEERGRVGVVREKHGDGWKAGEVGFETPEEGWLSWAEQHARSCSPGVLLRPLYQELLLQSAAVVVGPGEWNYWMQLPQAFSKHGLSLPALRLRDHGVVVSQEAQRTGWTLSKGWLPNEVWDRWVLDQWVAQLGDDLVHHKCALDKWNQDIQAWSREVSPGLQGPAGALEAATAKAWGQWMVKLRKSLKGTRAKEWSSARKGCESLVRSGLPQDRWANWNILAGDRVNLWKAQWLSETKDLHAVVWVLEEIEESKFPQNTTSSTSN